MAQHLKKKKKAKLQTKDIEMANPLMIFPTKNKIKNFMGKKT